MAAVSATILVVEGDESLRKLLRRALECFDHRVLTAANAQSALALFQHADEHIDLVVSDEWLRGMRGTELAEELRRLDPTVPILLVSGAFERPPGEFPELEMPFSLDELEQRIVKVIDAAASDGLPVPGRVDA